jgi:hypothetical protein
LPKAFLILITIWQDIFINVHTSSCKVHAIHQILIELEFYQHIFYKSSNREFYENQFNGSQFVPCRLMDRQRETDTHTHDEANSHFLQCCEHA